MNIEQNRLIRGRVRGDLVGRLGWVYVPEGMTEEEIQARFPDAAKAGLVRRLATTSRGFAGEEEDGGKRPEASDRIIYEAPPSITFSGQPAVDTPENKVSQGLSGPTVIEHVSIVSFQETDTGIGHTAYGIHVSTSKDIGPFQGDMTLFTTKQSDTSFGLWVPQGIILAGGRTAATPGDLNPFQADFFPRRLIPYSSFYLNVSTLSPDGTTEYFITVDFGQFEGSRSVGYGLKAIQPRFSSGRPRVEQWRSAEVVAKPQVVYVKEPASTSEPKPKSLKPAAAPKEKTTSIVVTEVRRYKNYAAIKVDEAEGVKPIWSTLKNTGEGPWGMPLAVTVQVKKTVPA